MRTPGEAKSTYGTGCFVLLNTGASLVHSTHGLISTVAFQLGPTAATSYALEGSVAIAGAGVAWLKDNLHIIERARDVLGMSVARSALLGPSINAQVVCGPLLLSE